MSHMTILRGGPGSGKTYLATSIATSSASHTICSADDFFVDANGDYKFDPNWLSRAHGACLKKCVEAMMRRKRVVIDNTNAKPDEMIPYLALCQAFGYTCEVIKVHCDRKVAWERQKHGVPEDKFNEIFTTVEQSRVPKLYRGAPWLTERDIGRPSCNCGVSSGVRSDHESECVAAYLRSNR